MTDLATTAPAFVEMAHRIVWCTVASVDSQDRPRSRILHPMWDWDGSTLTGWIATSPTPVKVAHLHHTPFLSASYTASNHDSAIAECRAEWALDDATRTEVWERFKSAPEPYGYDPAIVPPWAGGPTSEAFAVLKLEPWRLRVMPGSVMLLGEGEVLTWQAGAE